MVLFPKIDSRKFSIKLKERDISHTAVRMHRLTRQWSHFVRFVLFFIPEVVLLIWHIRRMKADVVHCNGSWQLKGVIAGRMARKKVVWHLNDTCMSPVVKRLFYVIAGLCSDGFIVAGQRVYDYYLKDTKLTEKPWCEIHAPVETDKFDPAVVEPAEKIRTISGIKILTVANINPRKGLENFIEAAAVLSSRHDNLRFIIVGPVFKSQEKYYQKLCEMLSLHGLTNVTFTDQISDVRPYLKVADICLFTSENEASPTSIWEAMSMGKAIVSTDVGSVSQHLRDGISGYIVPVGDVTLMTQRIEALLGNKTLRSQFENNARASALHDLGIDLCALKHAEFYNKILGKRS